MELKAVKCGTVEGYQAGCTCFFCRRTWASYQNVQRKARNVAKLPFMDKDLHGTVSMYQNYHCRCDDCKKAWSFYSRMANRIRKVWAISPLKALDLGGPPVKNASQWQP